LSLVVSRHSLKYFSSHSAKYKVCASLTHSLTHCTQFLTPQFRFCPEKRKICVTEELPRILWNHCDHRSPPLVFVWSHVSIFHVLTLYFFMVHFNIIPTFMPGLAKWSSSYGFFQPKPHIYVSSLACVLQFPPTSTFL